jgi:hypothetical protein
VAALQEVLQATGATKGPVDLKPMTDDRFLPAGLKRLN